MLISLSVWQGYFRLIISTIQHSALFSDTQHHLMQLSCQQSFSAIQCCWIQFSFIQRHSSNKWPTIRWKEQALCCLLHVQCANVDEVIIHTLICDNLSDFCFVAASVWFALKTLPPLSSCSCHVSFLPNPFPWQHLLSSCAECMAVHSYRHLYWGKLYSLIPPLL